METSSLGFHLRSIPTVMNYDQQSIVCYPLITNTKLQLSVKVIFIKFFKQTKVSFSIVEIIQLVDLIFHVKCV